MTRWEALTAICRSLKAGLLENRREPMPQDVSWELIVEVASFHSVSPALAGCLSGESALPRAVGDYFGVIAELNQKRNEIILGEIARVAGILNAVEIEPVLLKGASLLVSDVYPSRSQRLLSDVDILIPASRAAHAYTAMVNAGYSTHASDVLPPPTHHHLPMLRDRETGVGVELHTDVISPSPKAVIATDWFMERTHEVLLGNARVRVPEPTRNVAHIIFHSQVYHELYSLNKIQLRHMLDVVLMRALHGSAIDWTELDDRFVAGDIGEILATYLHFISLLFGQPEPSLSQTPRANAVEALRNTESQNSFHFQINYWKKVYGRLQTELSEEMAERGRVIADRDWFKAELARMTIDRDLIKAELARMTTDRDLIGAELERMTTDRDSVKAELGQITAERNRFRIEVDRFEAQLKRIKTSRLWKLLAPLHR